MNRTKKTTKELLYTGLPKWPMMFVTGESVSEDQALEIIRRTDSFFIYASGNNYDWVDWVIETLKFPSLKNCQENYSEQILKREEWYKKWNFINLEYVTNDWICSSFIDGPHGWIHPNGTIEYHYNIGKWPSPIEVLKDWKIIAKEFPFLNLGVTLFDNEYSNTNLKPVISFKIQKGKVRIIDPDFENIHLTELPQSEKDIIGNDLIANILNDDFGIGLSRKTILSWSERFSD